MLNCFLTFEWIVYDYDNDVQLNQPQLKEHPLIVNECCRYHWMEKHSITNKVIMKYKKINKYVNLFYY